MAKENNIDDEYALEALRTAVEIMREPAQNRDRLTAARSHPLAKAAIVSSAIDDFARVALLRAFEKEHRLLATVDHIAQRRPRSKVTMTAESRN